MAVSTDQDFDLDVAPKRKGKGADHGVLARAITSIGGDAIRLVEGILLALHFSRPLTKGEHSPVISRGQGSRPLTHGGSPLQDPLANFKDFYGTNRAFHSSRQGHSGDSHFNGSNNGSHGRD